MGEVHLHQAVLANDFDRVRAVLLDSPSSIYATDAELNTAAHIAASSPLTHATIVRLLVDAAPSACFAVNTRGELPAHVAARSGHTAAIAQFVRVACQALECVNVAGNTPLMAALKAGHAEAAQALVVALPRAMMVFDLDGLAPLHIACQQYCDVDDLDEAARFGTVLRAMLTTAPWAVASPAMLRVGMGDMSVLHMAALLKHQDLVRLVLDLVPAAVLDMNTAGDLPIHVAAWMGHGGIVCDMLAILPALTYAANRQGELPLHCAAGTRSERAVIALLEAAPTTATFLMEDGISPLYLAAASGNEGGVRALLQACPAMATISTASGLLPVYAAAWFGHHQIVDLLMDVAPEAAGMLAPLDGMNALHVAACSCCPRAVDVILQRAPQLATSLSADNKTALQLVLEREDCSVEREDAAVAVVLASLLRFAPDLVRDSRAMCDAATHGMRECVLVLLEAAPDTCAAGLRAALRAGQTQVACELVVRVKATVAFGALVPYSGDIGMSPVFVEAIKAHVPMDAKCWNKVPRRVSGLLSALPAVVDKGREPDLKALVRRLGVSDKERVQLMLLSLNHASRDTPVDLARRMVSLAV